MDSERLTPSPHNRGEGGGEGVCAPERRSALTGTPAQLDPLPALSPVTGRGSKACGITLGARAFADRARDAAPRRAGRGTRRLSDARPLDAADPPAPAFHDAPHQRAYGLPPPRGPAPGGVRSRDAPPRRGC